MITAGIDMGAKTVKVAIMKDGRVAAKAMGLAGLDAKGTVREIFGEALRKAGLKEDQVEKMVVTGAGRKECPFKAGDLTEVGAAAKGAVFVHPACRTVVDVGAEEGRAVRCDGDGKVIDFAINEKCAAGAGAFTEAMARALEVPVTELGALSRKSKNAVAMNAQCAVFAESEVVTLVHQQTPKEDMARAVHDAIASRIISMVRKVGFEKDVVLAGGVARNVGFVDSMNRGLEMEVVVPEDPEFIGAIGAAVAAGL